MFKVQWSDARQSFMATRWFHSVDAALAFAATRPVWVIWSPDGHIEHRSHATKRAA